LESDINFFSEAISFQLENTTKISEWIGKTISEESKTPGDINYIFCSDEYLHKMNVEHLSHDTYTDIITFNYCMADIINTDIFISIDRVKENAITYNTTFLTELHRVIIHGVLHLVGYDDKAEDDQVIMRAKEDFYLTLL
jgi:probable rRNA maturation factor